MKPRIKREVVITTAYPFQGIIRFYASREAASEFSEFGKLEDAWENAYWLRVDPRFDFDEVLAYIKDYNAE